MRRLVVKGGALPEPAYKPRLFRSGHCSVSSVRFFIAVFPPVYEKSHDKWLRVLRFYGY